MGLGRLGAEKRVRAMKKMSSGGHFRVREKPGARKTHRNPQDDPS